MSFAYKKLIIASCSLLLLISGVVLKSNYDQIEAQKEADRKEVLFQQAQAEVKRQKIQAVEKIIDAQVIHAELAKILMATPPPGENVFKGFFGDIAGNINIDGKNMSLGSMKDRLDNEITPEIRSLIGRLESGTARLSEIEDLPVIKYAEVKYLEMLTQKIADKAINDSISLFPIPTEDNDEKDKLLIERSRLRESQQSEQEKNLAKIKQEALEEYAPDLKAYLEALATRVDENIQKADSKRQITRANALALFNGDEVKFLRSLAPVLVKINVVTYPGASFGQVRIAE